MRDVTKTNRGKGPSEVQGRPMNFNVTGYEKFVLIWFWIPHSN